VICVFVIFRLVTESQICFDSLEHSSLHTWGKELSEHCSWIFYSSLDPIFYSSEIWV